MKNANKLRTRRAAAAVSAFAAAVSLSACQPREETPAAGPNHLVVSGPCYSAAKFRLPDGYFKEAGLDERGSTTYGRDLVAATDAVVLDGASPQKAFGKGFTVIAVCAGSQITSFTAAMNQAAGTPGSASGDRRNDAVACSAYELNRTSASHQNEQAIGTFYRELAAGKPSTRQRAATYCVGAVAGLLNGNGQDRPGEEVYLPLPPGLTGWELTPG